MWAKHHKGKAKDGERDCTKGNPIFIWTGWRKSRKTISKFMSFKLVLKSEGATALHAKGTASKKTLKHQKVHVAEVDSVRGRFMSYDIREGGRC